MISQPLLIALLCVPHSSRYKQAPLQSPPAVAVPRSEVPAAPTIPRIIHQSWKTDEVPERFREWQVRFRNCLV